ncbi:MAG: GumC family protein, partial [Pseudomonadota bacterium]
MQAHNPPPEFYEDESQPIDLAHYWRLVRQSWASILGLCLIVSLLTMLVVMREVPVYRATATILIESQQARTVSIEEVYSYFRNYQYFATQFEIIKNRDIAELAADKLDLWDDQNFVPRKPEDTSPLVEGTEDGFVKSLRDWASSFITTSSAEDEPTTAETVDEEEIHRNAVINKLLSGLSVEPVEHTQLGKIGFTSTNRLLTAEVANTVADVYIQSQMDSKMESTQEAGQWLASRLDDLKANLDASQQSLQAFRDQEEILDVAGGETLGVQELNELNSLLSAARTQRMGIENIYRELSSTSEYSSAAIMSMPSALQHPLVQSLAQSLTEAQQEVSNLGRRYGPEHPRMITATAREESIQAELAEQLEQVATSISAEYRLARLNEQQIEEQLSLAKQNMASLNRKDFRLQELQRQVETDQRLYEMFFTRAKEMSEGIGFHTAHARVVERAVPP